MTNRFQACIFLIESDWRPMNYAAAPYFDALMSIEHPAEMFYSDTGVSCVRYFLANSTSWRGPVARFVKAELKRMIAASQAPGYAYSRQTAGKGYLPARLASSIPSVRP